MFSIMRVHLVSMPTYTTYCPSIQTGTLKSFIDEAFKGNQKIETIVHSAHLAIPLRAFNVEYIDFHNRYVPCAELLWFTIFLKSFNPFGFKDVNKKVGLLTKKIDACLKNKTAAKDINKLKRATEDFIDEEFVPKLSKTDLNLVGFSLSVDQLYASLFAYFYLKKNYPKYKMLFVFGGGTVFYSRVLKLFKKIGVDGYVIAGEGELKLKKMLETCLTGNIEKLSELEDLCIYDLKLLDDKKIEKVHPTVDSQLPSIEQLPVPDYSEYFNVIKAYSSDQVVSCFLKRQIIVLLEGSRGCFYNKCSFCGLNMSWCKYRKKAPATTYKTVIDVFHKYQPNQIQFTDNATDPWLEEFCDLAIKDNLLVPSTFEMRATCKKDFFIKLSLIGCINVLIGVEALSDTLLKKMNKGTTVMDNLRALKYVKELNVGVISNLIIDYPGSTMAEIKETKKVLELTSHFWRLAPAEYVLEEYSIDGERLNYHNEKNIKDHYNLPSYLHEFIYVKATQIKNVLNTDVSKGWADFKKWYQSSRFDEDYLNVFRLSTNEIVIKEDREGVVSEYVYGGDEARVYTICHEGLSLAEVCNGLDMETRTVAKILKEFIDRRIMINVSDKYLSLALRPKEELINDYYQRLI